MTEELFEPHIVDTYRHQVQPAIKSKIAELKYLGYRQATEEQLWSCLQQKRWRKNEPLRLYQVVSDILTLSAHEFMSYLTRENYRNEDWFAQFEQEEQSESEPAMIEKSENNGQTIDETLVFEPVRQDQNSEEDYSS